MNSPRILPDRCQSSWQMCRFLTCSVLPVRLACNCHCPFCFSKSSISALRTDKADWTRLNVERFYKYSKERGAKRLVITGGGEPLLKADACVDLIRRGSIYFDEIALFTNGTFLDRTLAQKLMDAGLNYICYSRHHYNDTQCRKLMGDASPAIEEFVENCRGLTIRATCVMTKNWIDTPEKVHEYIRRLSEFGVEQFTFKHTYVAYRDSFFKNSKANQWSRDHQIESDPFANLGVVLFELPWGPQVRRIGTKQVCYYYEPTPAWELENRLCRSTNLLSDGTVYASLEDQRSQLFRLKN